MGHISVHHSKEEWEGHASKDTWVHFFVIRHTIGIGNGLENKSELIGLEMRWRNDSMIFSLIDLRSINVPVLLNILYFLSNSLNLIERSPEETHEEFISVLELIEGLVKNFLFMNEPLEDYGGCEGASFNRVD
jgi:hypothetical protein